MERNHHWVPNLRPCSTKVVHVLGKDETTDRYRAWAPNATLAEMVLLRWFEEPDIQVQFLGVAPNYADIV